VDRAIKEEADMYRFQQFLLLVVLVLVLLQPPI
jgi:hypothetical protein